MSSLAPLDKLNWLPDELTSGCNGQCVGFTVSDIVGNLIGKQCDLSFSYALGLYMGNLTPTTGGEDPYAGMCGAVVFGALLASLAQEQLSETAIEQVNINNYSLAEIVAATKNVQNGIVPLNSFTAIQNYLAQNIGGVSFAMQFYQSFLTPNPDSTFPVPSGDYSNHNAGIWANSNGDLVLKPYCGAEWGVGGYCFLTENTYNQCSVGAWGFSPTAWRWLQLVKIALQYPSRIPQILPLLSTTS